MKILAFAGSSSSQSINKKLVKFTCTLFNTKNIDFIDLNDFEMPVFSEDKEKNGIPKQAYSFAQHIDNCNLIVMSLAEHNGAYTAAFKNLFDWTSRIPNRTVFENKPILLMATSDGQKGGQFVLAMAKNRFPFNGGVVLDTFSLPEFSKNFKEDKGIINEELLLSLKSKVKKIEQEL